MRRLVQVAYAISLVALALLLASPLHAQGKVTPALGGTARETVRLEFKEGRETLYCVTHWVERHDSVIALTVKRVSVGDSLDVFPVDCLGKPTLHTHPHAWPNPSGADAGIAVTRHIPFILVVTDTVHVTMWPRTGPDTLTIGTHQ